MRGGLGAVENQKNLLPNNIALHFCILIEGPTTVAHTHRLSTAYIGAVAGIWTQKGSSPSVKVGLPVPKPKWVQDLV
jgi:hypothetical protein